MKLQVSQAVLELVQGAAGSIFFAGNGTVGGHVIGSTDKHAAYPTSKHFNPADVAATIYRAVGIEPHTLLHDRQNRPIAVLPEGEPIAGVLQSGRVGPPPHFLSFQKAVPS